MTARLSTLACVLLLAPLLLVGCGGSGPSKDAYVDGLAKMQDDLSAATKASAEGAGSTDPAKKRAALAAGHVALAKAADTAAKLDPPDDVKDAHADMVSALRDYADLFDKLAKLQPNDPNESQLYTDAGKIVARLEKANKALEKAGYVVEPSGGDKS